MITVNQFPKLNRAVALAAMLCETVVVYSNSKDVAENLEAAYVADMYNNLLHQEYYQKRQCPRVQHISEAPQFCRIFVEHERPINYLCEGNHISEFIKVIPNKIDKVPITKVSDLSTTCVRFLKTWIDMKEPILNEVENALLLAGVIAKMGNKDEILLEHVAEATQYARRYI